MKTATIILGGAAVYFGLQWMQGKGAKAQVLPQPYAAPIPQQMPTTQSVLPQTREQLSQMIQANSQAILSQANQLGVSPSLMSTYLSSAASQIGRAARISGRTGVSVEGVIAGGKAAGFNVAAINTFLSQQGISAAQYMATKLVVSPKGAYEATYTGAAPAPVAAATGYAAIGAGMAAKFGY